LGNTLCSLVYVENSCEHKTLHKNLNFRCDGLNAALLCPQKGQSSRSMCVYVATNAQALERDARH
jgi:hypothetical protein